MLRIHFTPRDLASTTVSSTAAPLWEILLSLHVLQHRDGSLIFDHWRRHVQAAVPAEQLGPLLSLTPTQGYSPDFLTPTVDAPDFDTALECVLGTPRRQLDEQLGILGRYRAPTSWTRALARAERRPMAQLETALRGYHQHAIAPFWRSVSAHVAAANAGYGDRLGRQGVDQVLSNLHPRVVWTPPFLQVRDMIGPDVYLNGRGLKLQLSAFCWRAPTKLLDPEHQPILVLPIQHSPALFPPVGTDPPHRLATLLGPTRAAALEAAAGTCTTTAMARHCKITPSAASYHAGILRAAGLISTERERSTVVHQATALGLRLLAGHAG